MQDVKIYLNQNNLIFFYLFNSNEVCDINVHINPIVLVGIRVSTTFGFTNWNYLISAEKRKEKNFMQMFPLSSNTKRAFNYITSSVPSYTTNALKQKHLVVFGVGCDQNKVVF